MPSNYSESYEEQTISNKSVDRVILKDGNISNEHKSPTNGHNSPIIEANTTKSIEKQANHGWIKGQSGNPAGRPKGMTVSGRLKAILDHVDDDTQKDGWELWAIALWRILTDPNVSVRDRLDATRILLQYTDGRPESHQYVHRDTTQLYSVLQIALSTTDMPPDIRARIIASIERQLGRTSKQAAIDVLPSNKAIEGEKAKEDP